MESETCLKRTCYLYYPALIAGGLLFSFSSSALANNYYGQWYGGHSSYGNQGKYRFRPLEARTNTRYNFATGRYQLPEPRYSQYRAPANNRYYGNSCLNSYNSYSYNSYNNRYGNNSYSHYRHSPYQNLRYRQPAFVRQFGWPSGQDGSAPSF